MPAAENFGDIYAGLYPSNPYIEEDAEGGDKEKKRKNKEDKEDLAAQSGIEHSKKMNEIKEKLSKEMLNLYSETTAVTRTSDLISPEDCTICLFIPYHKFM